MKKASRYCISLLALCGLFLAGCDNAEASSSADPSSVIDSGSDDISSVEPSDPELSQAHIDAIAGDNITLSGTCYIGTLEAGTTDYETTVKYADGYWQGSYTTMAEDWTTGEEYEYSEMTTFYRTADGYLAEAQAPDINNEVGYAYSTLWSQSIFQNMLYAFDASWFEWDSSYSDDNGYNKFAMTAEAIASEDVYYAEANLFSSIAAYTFGTSFGGDLQHFYIYTDAANENIVNIEFYEMSVEEWYDGSTYSYVTNISLDVSNIGTTVIDASGLYDPYTIPEGQESEYAAFESAIAHLEEHNYTATVQCIDTTDPNHIYQESKYEVTENGYSGYDYSYEYSTDAETGVESRELTSEFYYGTHQVEDGSYDYYQGYSADALSGVAGAGSDPWYNLADHDFAVEIFELVESESTASSYVFQLREDYMDNNWAYYVAGEFTHDYYRYYMEEDYAAGSNFKVSISSTGYIESFEFIYDDWTNPLTTFKQTFSDWGTTSITSDMGDFTNYVAYEYPNFDNTYVNNYDDNYNYISIRDALIDLFGEDIGNSIHDFMADDKEMAVHYSYGYYYPDTYSCLDITFDYYWDNYDWDELEAGYDAIAAALIEAGASLVEIDGYYLYEGSMCDGAVYVAVYIDSYYDVTVEFAIPSTEEAA